MKNRLWIILLAFVLIIGIAGCAKYYEVKDPTSGTVYYTKDVDEVGSGGAIKFEDAKTGSQITLQNSEVRKISKDKFKANTQE